MKEKHKNRYRLAVTAGILLLSSAGVSGCLERTAPPAPVLNLGAQIDSPTGAVIVRRYDTLFDISERYNLALRDIIDVNHIAPPYTIEPGQRIKLPAPREYRVEAGDTLYRISRMFGMNMTDLARRNNLSSPYRLNAGQTLRVNAPSTAAALEPASFSASSAAVARVERAPLSSRADVQRTPVSASASSGVPAVNKGYIWPVRGRVVSTYGPKDKGLHNDGINIAAAKGTRVKAASQGKVMYVGDALKGFGNLVLVRHANGWVTAYAHLDTLAVARGQDIRQGDMIGTVGTSGRVDEPQLHFEIRRGSEALNPQTYLPKV